MKKLIAVLGILISLAALYWAVQGIDFGQVWAAFGHIQPGIFALGLIPWVIAIGFMYVASGPTSAFVAEHPTTKMLALAFLMLIGVALIADGFDFHIPRGYIYFAMAFAGAVEAVNVAASRKRRERERP